MTTTKNKAIIVGNGTSRSFSTLPLIKSIVKAPMFGCNAVFEEYPDIDWLVAIDDKIIRQIEQSDFPKEKFLTTPFEEQFEPIEYSPNRFRENAGMIAMKKAIQMGFNELHCFGFDFLFADKHLNVSNIFENHSAYGPETRANSIDCMNRTLYLDWFASQHDTTEFLFLYPMEYITKHRYQTDAPNIKQLFIDM